MTNKDKVIALYPTAWAYRLIGWQIWRVGTKLNCPVTSINRWYKTAALAWKAAAEKQK